MEDNVALIKFVPTRTERAGNELLLHGSAREESVIMLRFGSEAGMKSWLLEVTQAILGERKMGVVTGQRITGEQLEDNNG
jgi:hypothetical protein